MLGALVSRDKEKVYHMKSRDGGRLMQRRRQGGGLQREPGINRKREEGCWQDNGLFGDMLNVMSAGSLRKDPLRLLETGCKGMNRWEGQGSPFGRKSEREGQVPRHPWGVLDTVGRGVGLSLSILADTHWVSVGRG